MPHKVSIFNCSLNQLTPLKAFVTHGLQLDSHFTILVVVNTKAAAVFWGHVLPP